MCAVSTCLIVSHSLMQYYFHPNSSQYIARILKKMNEYYDSEDEVVPATYKVEQAKSGRSTCAKSKELIPMGELRVGWYDKSERIMNYRVRLIASGYLALYLL